MTTAGESPVVVLAGGTGGAKLARGMLDVVGAEDLVVIANTGDDIDIYGAHVSPDPDLVSFWLADLIDDRGWGIEGDTFEVMDALRKLGADVWFKLGDRDLAWCVERRRMEEVDGLRPTEALARLNAAIGVHAQVLPMCDEPLRTHVRTDAGWRDFQRFMIADGAQGPVREVAFAVHPQSGLAHAQRKHARSKPSSARARESPRIGISPRPTPTTGGVNDAPLAPGDPGSQPTSAEPELTTKPIPEPTPEVREALAGARAVIVGPSNPVISIWPILHVLAEALQGVAAPVVCVSPVVGGEIVKGPTEAFLAAYGQPTTTAGVAAFYESIRPGLLDGIVADEPVAGMATLEIDVAMPDAAGRARVAERTLEFAQSLAG